MYVIVLVFMTSKTSGSSFNLDCILGSLMMATIAGSILNDWLVAPTRLDSNPPPAAPAAAAPTEEDFLEIFSKSVWRRRSPKGSISLRLSASMRSAGDTWVFFILRTFSAGVSALFALDLNKGDVSSFLFGASSLFLSFSLPWVVSLLEETSENILFQALSLPWSEAKETFTGFASVLVT